MSSSDSSLSQGLSKRTGLLGLKVWVVVGICVGVLMLCILLMLIICLTYRSRKRLRRDSSNPPLSQIPVVSKEIKEVRVEQFPLLVS